jgi:hypothetical protein
MELVKRACELPDDTGRSLSLWTCAELARALVREGSVNEISPQSVQRILASHKLKPWRVHHWLSSKVKRDEVFFTQVNVIKELYTRKLEVHERVFSLDEKTSIQPRTRSRETRPPREGLHPAQLEHEYERNGAVNLFAAFDTRSGQVIGMLCRRKRQVELIELLEKIDAQTPSEVTQIHLVCDNVSIHRGQKTCEWMKRHPRFKMHFTPVHCSWMNQVEQWFSILQKRRLTAPNFKTLEDLEMKITDFISQWNERAQPFQWKASSFDKVLKRREGELAQAA